MPFKYTDPDTNVTVEVTYDTTDAPNESPPGISHELEPDIGTDTEGWDLTYPVKRTLAQYLSNLTKGKTGPAKRGNEYSIDSNYAEIELTQDNGYPTSPALQYTGQFQQGEGYLRKIRSIPELGYSSESEDYAKAHNEEGFSIRKGVFKTGGQPSGHQQNGNDLLKSVDIGETGVTDPNDSDVAKKYVNVVLSHNRFTPTNSLVADAGGVSVKMGTAVGVNNFTDTQHVYTQNRLANVGPILSLRGSAEWGAMGDNVNPVGGTMEAKSILPSFAQLGIERIDADRYSVKDIVSNLTRDEDVREIDPAKLSWGVINNVNDTYFGPTALGMQVLSITLLASIVTTFELFGLLFSVLSKPEFRTRDPQGRYMLGMYRVNSKQSDPEGMPVPSLGPELIGITPTRYDYRKCVEKGLCAFYGADDLSGLASKAATAAVGSVLGSQDHPGQQIVVARAILRSSLTIRDAFGSIGGNPISIVKGVLAAIDMIKRSKFILAMNLFAQLGEQLIANEKEVTPIDKTVEQSPERRSRIDSLDPNTTQAVSMNRVGKSSTTLAIGAHRAPILALIPTSLASLTPAMRELGATPGDTLLLKYGAEIEYASTKLNAAVTSDGRLPTEIREKFEQVLDAEYVPFYFHDLRTNEIVSFHAFLTSLSDSFTPQFESVEGVGRIDAVKIYKNTQRKIELSFIVAATSAKDFDVMWIKVNKLVSYVYPQYTQGRTVFDGDTVKSSSNVFTQPFSQVIGASPVIRMRIGDVVRSNYSKFNLARLFGYGTLGMKVEGVSLDTAVMSSGDALTIANRVQAKMKQIYDGIATSPDYRFTLEPGTKLTCAQDEEDNDYVLEWTVGGSELVPLPKTSQLACTLEEVKNDYAVITVRLKEADEMPQSDSAYVNANKPSWEGGGFATQVLGVKYNVSRRSLVTTQKTYDLIVKEQTGGNQAQADEKLQNFMGESNNALVRSFKEAGGKGLAGVIESLNFNWLDNVPWEVLPGRTAPQVCKISLSFSPMHDIAPGIDHLGANRAPVFPVGAAYTPVKEPK